MIRLANLNPRIFNDSQTQLRHHSYEVPSKPAGHLRPECASLTTCTNDGKAKRQQGLLPNTLLFPGEAGSDPGLTPRCPDPLSQTFCFVTITSSHPSAWPSDVGSPQDGAEQPVRLLRTSLPSLLLRFPCSSKLESGAGKGGCEHIILVLLFA